MDKSEAARNAIISINQAKENPMLRPAMIDAVCTYFDGMKGMALSHADRMFMHYLSNQAGLPQYYHPMLTTDISIDDDISLQTLLNYVNESSLIAGEEVMLHRYQKEILDLFTIGHLNRYFLSASTSFGKTFLIYEIIRKMQYNTIVLIFPTIALMSENLAKINTDRRYQWVRERYKVHTLSDITEWGEHNLFIYTPERYLSFTDKNHNIPRIDFVFVDEAYKLDNSFVIDEEEKENERDITYRVALHFLLRQDDIDCLLAAPYVPDLNRLYERGEDSFSIFLRIRNIMPLDYNKYEIVGKEVYNVLGRKRVNVDNDLELEYPETTKEKRLIYTVSQLISRQENMIVYAYSRTSAESYAKKLIDSGNIADIDIKPISPFVTHLENSMNGMGKNWVVTRALKKGIGIHHGLVPKYIQNEIIYLFNNRILHTLICTTTITEGVNTTAKNMIILSYKKGKKDLKKFDAKNIEGRAGRFLQHYRGRVFILDRKFNDIMEQPDETLHHKYYDRLARKNDVDLMFVEDRRFMNHYDVQRKIEIAHLLHKIPLHELILNSYTTIPIEDKQALYFSLKNLNVKKRAYINNFVKQYNESRFFGTQNFDAICKLIRSVIRNKDLSDIIDVEVNQVCLFSIMVYYYLRGGLQECINYRVRKYDIDSAVQYSTKFVYNTLKYQAVKYLGLFNLIYRVVQMEEEGVAYFETHGIDVLLAKFEFNAETIQGRQVSDLGAPQRVVDYFDLLGKSKVRAQRKHAEMDVYEKALTQSIMNIISNE